MRKKHVKKDVRFLKFFTLVPIRIRDEVRWLETVSIRQKFMNGKWHNTDFTSW